MVCVCVAEPTLNIILAAIALNESGFVNSKANERAAVALLAVAWPHVRDSGISNELDENAAQIRVIEFPSCSPKTRCRVREADSSFTGNGIKGVPTDCFQRQLYVRYRTDGQHIFS
jgi:hypothetical protein